MLRRFAISLLLAAIVLAAEARTRPHYGGTLRVEIADDPWEQPDGLARQLVFDGLTQVDTSGAVRPALATAWEADSGYHRWQFRLRSGVHFHDGSTVTSTSVVSSLASSCSNDCPWKTLKAVGPSVVFTNDSPMPNLPALLSGNQFLIASKAAAESSAPAGMVGTGPFQVTGFKNGILMLAANESCWAGRPFPDGVEIRVRRPVREQWLDLSLGRADIVEVPAEQLRQAQQQRLALVSSPAASLLALQVSSNGPLSQVKLRQAIAAAVDRSALFNVIFQKQGEITASLLPQRMSGYSFLFPTNREMNKAHELRGGLSSGVLTMSTDSDATMQLAAQRLALNLREAGFNVQVTNPGAPKADLVLRRLVIPETDPAAALEQILRALQNPTPISASTSDGLYKAERMALDESTVIPLLDLPRSYARGARVRDLHLRSDGMPDLEDASLEDTR